MTNLISIGQVIDKTWEYYVKHFQTLMKVSLLASILVVIMLSRIFLVPEGESVLLLEWLNYGISASAMARLIIGILISVIATPIILTWIFIILVRVVKNCVSGRTVNIQAEKKAAWRDFIPYVVVMILKTLMIVLPLLALLPGITLTIYNQVMTSGTILTILGFILICIGLIIAFIFVIKWGIELAFSGFEMILAGIRGKKALAKSRKLVQGRFWKTLFRLLVPKIVFGIFVVIAELLVAFTGILIAIALFNINEWVGIYGTTILVTLCTIGIRILYVPIFVISDYLVYDSLCETR